MVATDDWTRRRRRSLVALLGCELDEEAPGVADGITIGAL
jgi:hypothetical protein